MQDREYERGTIEVVNIRPHRAGLDGDHATSATTLALVVNEAVFDADGGQVQINGAVYTYTAYDDDASTITLDGTGLAAAAGDDTWVNVYDPLYATIRTTKSGDVRFLGAADNDTPIRAVFSQQLLDKLGGGIRGTVGEECLLELDGDTWRIIDIFGLDDPDHGAGGTLFKRDVFTVTAVGDQTHVLSHEPMQDSLHLRWEPINMDDTEWTRDGQVVTIPDQGFLVDDVITAKYAYRRGFRADPFAIEFGSDGWKVLSVSEADTTNRSGVSFDDSGFSTITFPASDSLTAHPESSWLVPVSASWATHTAFWVRRTVQMTTGADVTVRIRVDDYLGGVWWNGVIVHAAESSSTPYGERTISIPGSAVTGTDVLAVKGRDAAAGARTYMDINVEVTP